MTNITITRLGPESMTADITVATPGPSGSLP